MSENYRAAIIGLGEIGYKIDKDPLRKLIWTHAKTFHSHTKTTLAAVSDIHKSNYDDFNNYYPNIKYYKDYRIMIKKLKFDIVSICTPTVTHLKVVKDLIRINPPKAIFIEKPMGINLSEAINITELCNKNHIILAVNYMRRWDNVYSFVDKYIKNSRLGNIQSITAYGSTALLTSTSHLIDLMILFGGDIDWLIGDLQQDYIRYIRGRPDPGGLAFIKFDNNCYGFLKGISKNEKNYMFEIDIIFSDGRIQIAEPWISNELPLLNVSKFSSRPNQESSFYKRLNKINFNNLNHNERMMDAVTDIIYCLNNDSKPKSNSDNSIQVHRFIESLKYSSNNQCAKVSFNG